MKLRYLLSQRPILFFASGGSPISAVDPPTPTPGRGGYVQCDYCKCRLTERGQVYEMSPEAYAFRDQKDNHSREKSVLEGQIAELRREKETLQAEVNRLKDSPASSSGGVLRV